MRIYYKSASVLISDRLFTVHGRPERRIADLDHVYTVSANTTLPVRSAVRHLWPAGAAVVACVVIAVWDVSSGVGPLLVPAVVVAVCGVVLLTGVRRAASAHELWAVVGHTHICLLRSYDERAFGEVKRALTRALEDDRSRRGLFPE